jgi:hypothetical protein
LEAIKFIVYWVGFQLDTIMHRFMSNQEVEKEVVEACQNKAYPVTVHFYLASGDGVPEPFGGGVLF